MKEQKWKKDIKTCQNHPNQTTVWPYYAYYKFHHVNSWSIVVTDVSFDRNRTRKKIRRINFYLTCVACHKPLITTLKEFQKCFATSSLASRTISHNKQIRLMNQGRISSWLC